MSYTIEYNRVFIKSKKGYTVFWLAGDNNVWEAPRFSGRERRARHWQIFSDFLGVSEQYMMEKMEKWQNEYDQHWKKNGQFLSNKQLFSWVKSGINGACTIEELYEINRKHYFSLEMMVGLYSDNYAGELRTVIKTTDDLDKWIDLFTEFAKSHSDVKFLYPGVDLSPEEIKKPHKVKELSENEKVILKGKQGYYLENVSADFKRYKSTKDSTKAMTFTVEEAQEIIQALNWTELRMIRAKSGAYNAIVEFMMHGSPYYVTQKVRGSIRYTQIKEDAKKFASVKEAQAFVDRYNGRFPFKFSVVELEQKEMKLPKKGD